MSGMETHSWVYGIIPTVTGMEYWECNLTHCYPKVGLLTLFPVLTTKYIGRYLAINFSGPKVADIHSILHCKTDPTCSERFD